MKNEKEVHGDIFNYVLDAIDEGREVKVDLDTKDLWVGRKHVISQGSYEGELGLSEHILLDPMGHIERLYDRYRHSIPSEKSDGRQRNYFLALPYSKISDEDMMFGVGREEARMILESTVLLIALSGAFKWDAGWFLQSGKHPDLILFRKWMTI